MLHSNSAQIVRRLPGWVVTAAPESVREAVLGRLIRAHTKGEARAFLREHLKLDALPDGVVLEEHNGGEPGAR